jgi:hypothetical protein
MKMLKETFGFIITITEREIKYVDINYLGVIAAPNYVISYEG